MASPDAPPTFDLAVDNFTRGDELAAPSQVLLARAAQLIRETTTEERWHELRPVDWAAFAIRGPCFQYARAAPPNADPSKTTATYIASLKEWGDLDISDHVQLSSLDDFDHSELYALFDSPKESSKRLREAGHDEEAPVAKRPRVDNGALSNVIPQPHMLASPLSSDLSHSPSGKETLFGGANPVSLVPPDTLLDRLDDPFARLAWVVPVRGQPCWNGLTPALVFAAPSPSSPTPQPDPPVPVPPSGSHGLGWTRDALLAFWKFLLDIRDCDNLGPVALSFYAVPPQTAPPSANTSSLFTFLANRLSPDGSHQIPTPFENSAPVSHRTDQSISVGPILDSIGALEANTREETMTSMNLSEVDHIKIYHDARWTIALRNVLHSWKFVAMGRKVRMLKGAKLVLLDERAAGVLVC